MKRYALPLGLLAASSIAAPGREVDGAGLDSIETIVVLYAENRSFDNLYGRFPGANGLLQLTLGASENDSNRHLATGGARPGRDRRARS